MPKLCQICGHVDMMGQADTCPKCGEATWRQAGVWSAPATVESVTADVMAPATVESRPASKSVPRRGGRS